MKIKLLIILTFLNFAVLAQKVENVKAVQEGKQVQISYDITGATQGQKFEVSLYYSSDFYNWKQCNMGISGDAGANITGGIGKQIKWDVLKEVDRLVGENYMFKVKATVTGGILAKQNYTESALGLNLKMIYVQGGTFKMGCTSEQSNCRDDEKPVHSVTLSDYYIGKYEITQKQWRAVMGTSPSSFKDCDNCPVESVSWNEIQDFIKKLNEKTGKTYSLPTEAQWEYAARGGNKSKGYKYSGSNAIENVAWFESNSGSKTQNVGTKSANELGIYDMTGNVWEWCSDWYSSDYYKNSPQNNPENTTENSVRVLRGGSWFSNAAGYRVSYRNGGNHGRSNYFNGFRLVSHSSK